METKLRTCLRDPIPEIYDAARYLDAAVAAHIAGETGMAEDLIRLADMPKIRAWTESIWGSGGVYTELQQSLGEPKAVPKDERDPIRMPNKQGVEALHDRDGYHCKFCGIPVIRKEVREIIRKQYPSVLSWGKKNVDQHAAFQAMWVQYDHILPHARGGATDLNNMVITCAPCNYGRMNYLVEEIGLAHPDMNEPFDSSWDGLERILLE